jgi:hypothetical protein
MKLKRNPAPSGTDGLFTKSSKLTDHSKEKSYIFAACIAGVR